PVAFPDHPRVVTREAVALVSDIQRRVADRELEVLARELELRPNECRIEQLNLGYGPGNTVSVLFGMEGHAEMFTAFGEKRRPAGIVATDLAHEARLWLESRTPVGTHLADQLLLPLTLTGGSFLTPEPTPHTRTN